MTSRSTWKKAERDNSVIIGSVRTPLSGSNSRHNTMSDSLHPEVYLEVKYRLKHTAIELFRKYESIAKKENKIMVLALKQKGVQGNFWLVKPEDIEKLGKILEKVRFDRMLDVVSR